MKDAAMRILLVEDDPAQARLLRETLVESAERFEVMHAENMAEALACLPGVAPAAVLLDLTLPDSRGLNSLDRLLAAVPHLPILVLTGVQDEELATEAIRRGAQDYLIKGEFDGRLVARAVRYAIERSRMRADQQRAEEALRASEELFRLAADNLPDAFVIYDAQRRFHFVNAAALHLCGIHETHFLGKRDEEIFPPQVTETYLPTLQLAIGTRRVQTVEATITPPERPSVTMVIAYVPVLDAKGQIRQVIGITHDITERLRAAQAMNKAKEAAEDANRAKSEFLANISHELRTPMNAVLGMADLALGEPMSPVAHEYVETARDSARVLLALLNELLDFSRIEAGQFQLEIRPFRLREVIDETMKVLSVRAYEKKLELACDMPAAIPAVVLGDSLRLRQVLMNLVGNAIKFTEHGEVVVRMAIDSQTPSDVRLKFAVCDTGIGIAAQDQQKIFAPFTQADASTSRLYGGTGLGLAITKKLIASMNGEVWLESQVGCGSTFSFTVRLGLPEEVQPAAEPSGLERLRGDRVLIAESSETSRRIVEQLLSSWGVEVETATDGQETLDKIHRAAAAGSRFPLVILSTKMPGIDGPTLAQWIRSDPELAEAVILMGTAAERPAGLRPGEAANHAIWLEKPVTASGLSKALRRASEESLKSPPVASMPTGVSSSAIAQPALKPLRILLAEDTPANQKLVVRILTKRGHTVEVAQNGCETVERVIHERFDLVLMDVSMPVMDGIEATAKIRALAEPARARVPIIAMTAHAMKGDKERCLAAGMNGYLAKPVDARELVETVESYAKHLAPAAE